MNQAVVTEGLTEEGVECELVTGATMLWLAAAEGYTVTVERFVGVHGCVYRPT